MTLLLTLRQFLLISLFLPTIVLGQKKYKYEYKIHLTNQLSTYTTQLADTLTEPDKCILTFIVLTKTGDFIPYASIKIKGRMTDTLFQTDFNGYANITLPFDTFDVSVTYKQLTTLQLEMIAHKVNTNITIKSSLGISNDFETGNIFSVRKLTEVEIKKIIDDLSNDKDDNELIKNKVCYVSMEI